MNVKAKHDIRLYLSGDDNAIIPEGTMGELQPFVAAFIGLVPVIFKDYGYINTSIDNLIFIKENSQ